MGVAWGGDSGVSSSCCVPAQREECSYQACEVVNAHFTGILKPWCPSPGPFHSTTVLPKENHSTCGYCPRKKIVSIVVKGSSEKEISTCTEVYAAAPERQADLAQSLEEVGL